MDSSTAGCDEQAILERVRRGDQAAYRGVVERYQGRLFAVARGILRDGDEASDVVQETFLRAYLRLATFHEGSQLFTWLYRIAVNLCLDRIRRRRREAAALYDARLDRADVGLGRGERSPFEQHAAAELSQRLLAALDGLPPAHRAVIVLREVEGLSYAEIARAVGCPVGTVMSRLFHARRKLQLALADERAEEMAA
jgi:RNA polymerase sigma-70 factor (ECF subfamily)